MMQSLATTMKGPKQYYHLFLRDKNVQLRIVIYKRRHKKMCPKIYHSREVCVEHYEKIPMDDLFFGKLSSVCIQP